MDDIVCIADFYNKVKDCPAINTNKQKGKVRQAKEEDSGKNKAATHTLVGLKSGGVFLP